MSHITLHQRMLEVKNRWSIAERKRRADMARRRCAELLARYESAHQDPNSYWAAGAMTPADVARIAG